MTCKTLANKLNTVNNTNNIKVVKEHGYYIIKCDGYESGLKVMTIKGVC